MTTMEALDLDVVVEGVEVVVDLEEVGVLDLEEEEVLDLEEAEVQDLEVEWIKDLVVEGLEVEILALEEMMEVLDLEVSVLKTATMKILN